MSNPKEVPYLVFESVTSRLERINKRLFLLILVLITLLVSTNLVWIYYTQQFTQETVVTQEAEVDGDVGALINNGGDLVYGTEAVEDDSETNSR